MVKYLASGALLLGLGCGSFADPAVVVDLRALAITAEPPEQLLDIDISKPPTAEELLAQLKPIDVCALLQNPGDPRPLRWQLSVCGGDINDRCPEAEALIVFGTGVVGNPGNVSPEPKVCATLQPSLNLLFIVQQAINNDQISGLGGINVNVELKFAVDEDFATAPLYATKKIVLSPRIPAERQANRNPIVSTYTAQIAPAAKQPFGDAAPLPLGRCIDLAMANQTPFTVAAGNRVRITPVEPPDAREPYVVPTLSGGSRMFTESLTYQWLATFGGFTAPNTGGPRDAFGNPALLYTDWKVPSDIAEPRDVSLWILPRDERKGSAWAETCIRVVP